MLEGKLIKEFHPRYNISFRDDKRFLLLKVNLNDPIPRFTLTRLQARTMARDILDPSRIPPRCAAPLTLVRRKFNLRGCRPLTPGEDDYKHCLYGNLKYLHRAMHPQCHARKYKLQVLAACEFLDGQTEEIGERTGRRNEKGGSGRGFREGRGVIAMRSVT